MKKQVASEKAGFGAQCDRNSMQPGRAAGAVCGCVLVCGFAGLSLGTTPAMAQEQSAAAPERSAAPQEPPAAPGQSATLTEVVVSAQRRLQSLQDVPIAVTALSADSLEARGIRSALDLNTATPSLNITEFIKAPVIFLRGLGTTSTVPGQEQNVAVYVDGVYYASMIAGISSFNNLERVEVLKGPQGTLFGRNTTGGLLQIVTRDPSHVPSARMGVTYGDFDTTRVSAYGTTGIGEHLAADLSIMWIDQRKGWGRNLFDGSDVSLRDERNFRTKWVFEPFETTKLTWSASYIKTNSDLGISRQMLEGTPTLPPAFGSARFTGNIYDVNANTDAASSSEQKAASMRLDQQLGFARLVGIAGWQKVENYTRFDFDGTPGNMRIATWDPDKSQTFTGELQLLAPESSSLQWITGLYYFHNEGFQDLTLTGNAFGRVARFANVNGSTNADSYSAFAQATYPLFAGTNVTLGARYTEDEKTLDASQSTALSIARAKDRRKWGNATYRFALDHKLTDDVMGYASISTGFKSGLFNLTSPLSPPVDPEKVLAYELGMKSTFLQHRLRLNLASFYYDYTDIQTTRIVANTSVLQNAAGAQIYGFEAELEAAATENLFVHSGLSAMHSRYTDFADAAANVPVNGIGQQTKIDATGKNLPRAPELTLNLGLEYRLPTPVGEVGFDTNYYYNGGFYWEPDNRLKQGAYQLVNAGVSWTSRSKAFGLRLWADNLFSEQYLAYVTSASGGPDVGAAGAPRTFGITLDLRL
jgi:iron complex outermembrane receptor protein